MATRRKRLFVSLMSALAPVAGIAAMVALESCRAATEITLVLTTDMGCDQFRNVAITAGRPDQTENEDATVLSTRCEPDGLGSIVLTPRGSKSDRVAIKIVTTTKGKDPVAPTSAEECQRPPYASHCIVARRVLPYIPHTGLTLPIALNTRCAGIFCAESETCVVAVGVAPACRSSEIPDPKACVDGVACGQQVLAPGTPRDMDGGLSDATVADATVADAAVSDADASDAGGVPVDIFSCTGPQGAGLQRGAPSAMAGRCPDRNFRYPVRGPQTRHPPAWQYPASNVAPSNEGSLASTSAVAADGTIYSVNTGPTAGQGSLRALRPGDGQLKWRFNFAASITSSPSSSPAIGKDGVVYVGSSDNTLHAIYPDGGQKWASVPLGGEVYSSPLIGPDPDGTVYVVASSALHALRADGGIKWNTGLSSDISLGYASPVMGADGTIYVGGSSTAFAIADEGDAGTVIWQRPLAAAGSAYSIGTCTLAADGTLYAPTTTFGEPRDASLYALFPDGGRRWSFTTPHGFGKWPAIGLDKTVYIGGWGGTVFALDPADGGVKHTFRTDAGSHDLNCAPTLDSIGTVYIGSGPTLYALETAGLTEKWSWPLDSDILQTVLGGDGTLYVGTTGGYLYAFAP